MKNITVLNEKLWQLTLYVNCRPLLTKYLQHRHETKIFLLSMNKWVCWCKVSSFILKRCKVFYEARVFLHNIFSIHYYGKLDFCKNGRFSLSRSHMTCIKRCSLTLSDGTAIWWIALYHFLQPSYNGTNRLPKTTTIYVRAETSVKSRNRIVWLT